MLKTKTKTKTQTQIMKYLFTAIINLLFFVGLMAQQSMEYRIGYEEGYIKGFDEQSLWVYFFCTMHLTATAISFFCLKEEIADMMLSFWDKIKKIKCK